MSTHDLSAAINVMRAIATHFRDVPADYQIVGLPHACLTVGHCRALAAIPDNGFEAIGALSQGRTASSTRTADVGANDQPYGTILAR